MRFDGVNITVMQKERTRADLLARLQKAVGDKHLRLYPHFREGDSKRRGVITKTQALTALTVLKLDLGHADLDELFARYCNAEGLFMYPAFCADAEGSLGFTVGGEATMHTVAAGHNGAPGPSLMFPRVPQRCNTFPF